MLRITLLTSYMHQRGGDLVATLSFVKAVVSQRPDVTFEWVVKRDIASHQKDLQKFMVQELGPLSALVHLTVIDSADYKDVIFRDTEVVDKNTGALLSIEELRRRSDANWGVVPHWHGWKDIHPKLRSMTSVFSAAQAIVIVANPHRMVKEDHDFLHRTFHKKIVIIPEYSLMHANSDVYHPGDIKLNTGFTENGVYIDEMIKFAGGFECVEAGDIAFLQHLLKGDPNEYHARSHLFYGYFFDNEAFSPSSSTVKTKSFIQNAIMLAMDRHQKENIDLVIPGFADPMALRRIYQEALAELPSAYQQQMASAAYHVKHASDEFNIQSIRTGVGHYHLRLINPQRLQRRTVQVLLNEADPFMGLTGDASWIEGLMKGKITCYQIVNWKHTFFYGFLEYLKTKFKPSSPLYQFYLLQGHDALPANQRWEKMRELYIQNQDKMLEEAALLAQFIEQEKNLNKTLIPTFLRQVVTLEKKDKMPHCEVPAQTPAQAPAQTPAQAPAQTPAQAPAQTPAQTLAQTQAQTPTQAQKTFIELLDALDKKVRKFRREGHSEAANMAAVLHINLKEVSTNYFSIQTPTKADYLIFKKGCNDAIHEERVRSVLEKHRGWKNFIFNLGLAILGVGVIYFAAAMMHYVATDHKYFFFRIVKTDSMNKMQKIEKTIMEMDPDNGMTNQ